MCEYFIHNSSENTIEYQNFYDLFEKFQNYLLLYMQIVYIKINKFI
jgi:hypothetical protein